MAVSIGAAQAYAATVPRLDGGTACVAAGGVADLPITYTTDNAVVAFQLDLSVPSGFTALLVAPGPALDDHVVRSRVVSNAMLRGVIYSPSNAALVTGKVVFGRFTVPASCSGQRTISINSVVLATALGGKSPLAHAPVAGTVSCGCAAMQATATATTTSGPSPLAVTFSGTSSGGSPPHTFNWDFGDGSAPETGQSVPHTFLVDGQYTVTLAVRDAQNQVALDSHLRITVGSNPGLPGDASGDGSVNVQDVFYLINFLFAGGPDPLGDADCNNDAAVNVSDVFYLINYLFAGGPAPV